MFKIGCHLSSSGGYLAMGKEAVRIGANDFQFFTRNPRGGQAKPLDLDDIKAFEKYRKFAASDFAGNGYKIRFGKRKSIYLQYK